MDSSTLTGRIREIVAKMLKPPAYEARVVSAPDSQGRVYVTSRPLTGTGHRLGPFQAAQFAPAGSLPLDGGGADDGDDDGAIIDGGGADDPDVSVRVGDRVWLTVDESGQPSHLSGWDG